MMLSAALRQARAALAAGGIADAGFEARLLLGHQLGRDPRDGTESEVDAAVLEGLLARRLAHEPMAFILGRQGFWDLELEVSAATLIPRADSETLVEAAFAARPDRSAVRRVLDLGTGTGCLLLAVLGGFPEAWGVGVDVAAAAAALAARNAARNGLGRRCGFVCGDWDEAIEGRFDLVLCNPPYIESGSIDGLMPDVSAWEPRRALDGGADGLDCYRRVMAALPRRLSAGAVAVVELGVGQGDPVGELAAAAGLRVVLVRPDLGGIPRAMVLAA